MSDIIFTRLELVEMLNSMGAPVNYPCELTDDDLKQNLCHAFNWAQRFHQLLPGALDAKGEEIVAFDPKKHPTWPSSRSVFNSSVIIGLDEFYGKGIPLGSHGEKGDSDEVFHELRLLTLDMAWACDQTAGSRTGEVCLLDRDKEKGIHIKLFRPHFIRCYEKNIPVLFFQYRSFDKATHPKEWNTFIPQKGGDGRPVDDSKVTYFCDVVRRAFLLLVQQNRSLLAPEVLQDSETGGYQTAFLLPFGPLDQLSLGKLISLSPNSPICSGCDFKYSTKVCSGCQAVYYCSKECQKTHWQRVHKAQCEHIPWEKGTWVRFQVRNVPTPIGGYSSYITRGRTVQNGLPDPGLTTGKKPPHNKHGDKVFIGHIQFLDEEDIRRQQILFYDRTRSFTAIWHRRDEGPGKEFSRFLDGAQSLGFGDDLSETFVWMRRVGQWEFEICIDRFPPRQKWYNKL